MNKPFDSDVKKIGLDWFMFHEPDRVWINIQEAIEKIQDLEDKV